MPSWGADWFRRQDLQTSCALFDLSCVSSLCPLKRHRNRGERGLGNPHGSEEDLEKLVDRVPVGVELGRETVP